MAVKDSTRVLPKPVRSVAVIGGGASGAIALDALLTEQKFDRITVFERRDRLGGVWAFDVEYGETVVKPGLSEKELDPPLQIPETLHKVGKLQVLKNEQPRYERSPAIYNNVRTNVPERIMTYSDNKKFPFLDSPDDDELTTLPAVNQYINDYFAKNAGAVGVSLNLNTFVEKISKVDLEDGQYEIISRKIVDDKTDEWSIHKFDAVLVATGHYHVPYMPKVDGLDELIEKYPGRAVHSKGFSKFEDFGGKKVIVVGGHASSVDTVRAFKAAGADITWSRSDVEQSTTEFETLRRPKISNYEFKDNGDITVHFLDGTKLENPEKIIYATGYQFSYPFLRELDPNIIENAMIPNVFYHTFHIEHPHIAFAGTAVNGMSFRVFEYQAVLAARFFAGKISLPSKEEQILWRDERILTRGVKRGEYHRTDLDPALKYIEELVELGGGYEALEGSGRDFPKFSEEDLEVYAKNRERLHGKWENL